MHRKAFYVGSDVVLFMSKYGVLMITPFFFFLHSMILTYFLNGSGKKKGQHFPALMKLKSGVVGSGTEVTLVTFSNLFTLSVCSCADLSADCPFVFCCESHKVLPSKKKKKRLDNSSLCWNWL